MHQYLASLTDSQRDKLRRDSIAALRHAWTNRHTLRGRQITRANVSMLRNLRAL